MDKQFTQKIFLLLTFIITLVILFIHPLMYTLNQKLNKTLSRLTQSSEYNENLLNIGSNVDTLPQVKINFGRFKPVESLPENAQDIEFTRQQCLTKGYRLGSENTSVDCQSVCQAQEVAYKYISNSEQVVINNKLLAQGAYCLPTDAAICNTKTSILIYGISRWLCLNQISDYFGGNGGSRIDICNGKILDNLNGQIYENTIPSNIVMTDFINEKVSENKFRFECLPQQRSTESNINYINSDFDRFRLIENFCITTIPLLSSQVSNDTIPDWNASTYSSLCKEKCKKQNYDIWNLDHANQNHQKDTNILAGSCIACKTFVDKTTWTTIVPGINTRNLCYSIMDNVEFVKRIFDTNLYAMPCGFKGTDSSAVEEEYTRPRCREVELSYFRKPLPSHNTIKLIADNLDSLDDVE